MCLTLASKWQQSSCFSLPNAEITGVCFSSRLLQHPKAMVLRCQRLDKGTVNVSPLLAPVQMAHTRVRDGPFWAPAVPAPLETEAEKQPHVQGQHRLYIKIPHIAKRKYQRGGTDFLPWIPEAEAGGSL